MSLDFYVRIIGKDQTGPAVRSAKKNFEGLGRDARGRFVGGGGGSRGTRRGGGLFGNSAAELAIAAQGIDELSRKSRTALVAPLSAYMDFEAQLDAVSARLSGSPKEIADGMALIEKRALEVGKDVKGATALQGAGAAEFLAQAGWSPAEIDAALVPMAKFSKAMRTDLSTTADIVSDVAGQFGIPATEVAENLGRMTKGINMANMDLRTFFEAAKFGGPVMAALGNDLSDSLAIFGALANVGLKGSLGGTTVRSLTRVLEPRGKRGRQAAEELGVSRDDLVEKGIEKDGRIDIPKLFQEIARTVDEKGMGGTDSLRALKDLFGQESLAGTASLLALEIQALGQKVPEEIAKAAAEGGADLKEKKSLTQLDEEIRGAGVTDLEDAYARATGNTKSSVEELKAGLEDLAITAGKELAPVVVDLLPDLKEGVTDLAAWAKANGDVVRAIGKGLGVIAVLGPAITPLVLSLSALKTVVSVGSGGAGLVKGILGAARALDGKTGLVAGLGKLGVVGAAATAVIWGGIQAYDALVARGEVLEKQKEIAADEKLTDTYQKGEFRSAVAGLSEEELRAELGASTKLEDGSWSRGTEGQVIGATRSKEPGFLARWLGAESTVVQTGRARQEVLQEAVNRGVATDAQRAELIAGTVQTTLAKLGVTREENVQKVIQQELAKANLTFNVHVKKDGRVEVVASSDSGKVNTTQQLDTGVVAGS